MRPEPALSHGARATAELLERFGLRPDKSLGQHFLVDPNQVDRIVRLAGVTAGDHVVEVGPGLGALTAGLLSANAEVVAVEIDQGLVEALQAQFAGQSALRIVHHDALTLDWHQTLSAEHRWSMVANLPYNVATPLVLDVLDTAPHITSLLVMVQREVAERLVAVPGTGAYGIPSVKVAFWGKGELVARIPPSVFLPQPRVESALVRIDRHIDPPLGDSPNGVSMDAVFELVRTAFGQRRKMLRRSLGQMVTSEQFEWAAVSEQSRPERLSVDDWCRLAESVRRDQI